MPDESELSLVSVIIPCWNAMDYVCEAVESVLSQSYKNLECVLIDDGSTDNTLQLLKEASANNEIVHSYSKNNGGRASALNYGVSKASNQSRYFLFLDADDILDSAFLSKTVSYLEKTPEAGAYFTGFWEFESSRSECELGHRSRYVPSWPLPRDLGPNDVHIPFVSFYCSTGQGPYALIRSATFHKTLGFEVSLNQNGIHGNEDTDIYCQLSAISEIHYTTDCLYFKREHGANVTRTANMGYARFREIWDHRLAEFVTEDLQRNLLQKYYQRVFAPLRCLKVAIKTLLYLFRKPTLGGFNWMIKLIARGLPFVLFLPWYWLIFLPALNRLPKKGSRLFQ